MDLQSILLLSPAKLDNDLKDDLYNYITYIDIDSLNVDKGKIRNLIKIAQEILRYKGEQVNNKIFAMFTTIFLIFVHFYQVDSLISEFDEMARRQGEEEAKRIQHLENEIKSLRSGSRKTLIGRF